MTHYDTLQVTREAEPEVIDKAYRALTLKYHPDVATGVNPQEAESRIRAINEAYAVLGDARRRQEYDALIPPQPAALWDRFLESGIIGLLSDHLKRSAGA